MDRMERTHTLVKMGRETLLMLSLKFAGKKNGRQSINSLKAHLHDIHYGYGTPTFWHADQENRARPAWFLPCKSNFFGPRAEKCRPRPPQEVVSARLKRGPRAANQMYSRPQPACAHDWPRNRRLWGQKWAFWAPNILYFSREDGVEGSPNLRLE